MKNVIRLLNYAINALCHLKKEKGFLIGVRSSKWHSIWIFSNLFTRTDKLRTAVGNTETFSSKMGVKVLLLTPQWKWSKDQYMLAAVWNLWRETKRIAEGPESPGTQNKCSGIQFPKEEGPTQSTSSKYFWITCQSGRTLGVLYLGESAEKVTDSLRGLKIRRN